MTPEIQDELHKILIECREEDWNGYGARRLNLMVYANTVLFLSMLPNDIPEPELVPEPNGYLTMVWRNEGRVMITASDGLTKEVQMLCGKPWHFDDNFYYFENGIPENILKTIRNIMKCETIS